MPLGSRQSEHVEANLITRGRCGSARRLLAISLPEATVRPCSLLASTQKINKDIHSALNQVQMDSAKQMKLLKLPLFALQEQVEQAMISAPFP